jgi:hypothetical protein
MPSFKPTGLAPQQVVSGLTNNDATRDTYQRKVWFDGVNFFIWYFHLPSKEARYTASADGIMWTTPISPFSFSVAPYYGGNFDAQYPNRGSLSSDNKRVDVAIVYAGSNGGYFHWQPYQISGQILVRVDGGAFASDASQGGSDVASLNAERDYYVYHRKDNLDQQYVCCQRSPANSGCLKTLTQGVAITGGTQILPYQSQSPFNLIVLAKDASSVLQYNILVFTNPASFVFAGDFIPIATLGNGFSDFCGCSEAQSLGASERVHMVYVKSTGELCYRKFESDTLGNEKVLVSSGASYPVIAAGSSGKLYVFYVKSGKIWVIHYTGSAWLKSVELFTKDHTYDTPVYLSTNQYVQNGLICLVWTEGASSPYELWFCYLED